MVSTSERRSHRGGRRRGGRARGGRRRGPSRRAPTTAGDVVRGVFRTIGELMFTAGLVMLLFAAFQVYGKQFETDKEQDQLAKGLESQWEKGPDSKPLPGSANSRMYIPSLDLDWVVVNGVEQEDIKYSPGHYPYTADAGQKGNYSVAGHRTPGIFWDLDRLRDGDDIVLEDAENFYTYKVVEDEVITPDQMRVVAPDPFADGADPFDKAQRKTADKAMLTLTTCHPKLQNAHRYIVHAELAETRSKDKGMPDNIADMAPEEGAMAEKKGE
ncbi:sortase A [Murinocardiopsis flavida]|uniref:Sortase A n=1 Tax=Murinocardiopsis flavida TaxID=645275 RepID=A0A2P8CMT4_9ACTN|nr:class E sortase [Murinocardiopsis flavida]PSK86271.1 sortase A [Murinocardiopsis flavida]